MLSWGVVTNFDQIDSEWWESANYSPQSAARWKQILGAIPPAPPVLRQMIFYRFKGMLPRSSYAIERREILPTIQWARLRRGWEETNPPLFLVHSQWLEDERKPHETIYPWPHP